MRILIVEDEIRIRIGIGKLISSTTKHKVIAEAKNGKEGIEMFLRYKPDLIITDIRMPEMDGLEMLREIRKIEMDTMAVVLTGYAEFEYAKKAIDLGVIEYLIKPIGVEDVINLLDKIDKKLDESYERIGSLEINLREIYMGDSHVDDSVISISDSIHIHNKSKVKLYMGYVGAAKPGYRSRFYEVEKEVCGRFTDIFKITIYMEKVQEIIGLYAFCDEEEMIEFEQLFLRKIIMGGLLKEAGTVWSAKIIDEIHKLPEAIKELERNQEYSYLFGTETIVQKKGINEIPFDEFIYPMELENKWKVAICNGNREQFLPLSIDFKQYFRTHRFLPSYVKHAYLKLVSYILNILQEIDKNSYEQLQNICILKQISDARLLREEEACLDDVVRFLGSTQGRKEDVSNYTIKRAINYIREHFYENVGLEEVAAKLDITPEYLSTLFNKEVGTNFTLFLKEFRISHAKRLLQGTDLKIYEIAEKVGYHDPKYFMRVFKEIQGVSPKEYRVHH